MTAHAFDKTDMPIIVLAAGSSSRMRGADKLMQDIEGQPLLRRQVERASAVSSSVIVTLPAPPHPRYPALTELDVDCVPVPEAALGMAHSLRAGLAALPENAEHAMILLPDMPKVTAADIAQVVNAVTETSDALIWRGMTSKGEPGHPIVFHHSLFKNLSGLTGDQGGAQVVSQNKDKICFVPLPDDHARLDLDTPEAWKTWRRNQKAGST